MGEFSHIDKQGKAAMVDISQKGDSIRIAQATGFIELQPFTVDKIEENSLKKGDVISVAELAGIMAAKQTPTLIPLCHTINLSKVDVHCKLENKGVRVTSFVKCVGPTGVEMEALTAVNIALLTIYDMCKAIDKNMNMSDIRLISKEKHIS